MLYTRCEVGQAAKQRRFYRSVLQTSQTAKQEAIQTLIAGSCSEQYNPLGAHSRPNHNNPARAPAFHSCCATLKPKLNPPPSSPPPASPLAPLNPKPKLKPPPSAAGAASSASSCFCCGCWRLDLNSSLSLCSASRCCRCSSCCCCSAASTSGRCCCSAATKRSCRLHLRAAAGSKAPSQQCATQHHPGLSLPRTPPQTHMHTPWDSSIPLDTLAGRQKQPHSCGTVEPRQTARRTCPAGRTPTPAPRARA